jgi:hypothetical protein
MIAYLTDRDPCIAVTAGERLLVLLFCYMTCFISATLVTWACNLRLREFVDVADPEKAHVNPRDILADLDARFFEADWKSTNYDTRAGRD